jgi:tetratricopeptide (TPR) repeat protein
MKGLHASLLLSLFFFATLALQAQTSVVPEMPESLDAALKRNDMLFESQKYTASRKLLEGLLEAHPHDAEVLWRLASHMINDGDGTHDAVRKEALYKKAVEYSEAAVAADGKNANARAYLAASWGSVGMFAGGKEKVKLANKIRDELDRALALDPNNQVALTIYGTWHREVSEVSWIERQLANMFLGSMPDGSIEESIRYFKAAIHEGPKVFRHRFELARSYIAADRMKDAADSFRAALKCPTRWKTDNPRRHRIKEWLKENG